MTNYGWPLITGLILLLGLAIVSTYVDVLVVLVLVICCALSALTSALALAIWWCRLIVKLDVTDTLTANHVLREKLKKLEDQCS